MKRIIKAALGLLAAGTAVGVMGLPAAANTMTFTIDGGVIDIYDSGDTLKDSILLGTTGCGTSQVSITATATGPTSGDLVGTLSSDGAVTLLGDDYVSTLTATIVGSYEYIGSGTYTVTLFVEASVTLDPSTGVDSCTKTSTDDCSITIGGITLSGVYSGSLPTMVSLDTAQLTGGSSTFSILVGTGCPGPISAINDGYVVITGLTLTAI